MDLPTVFEAVKSADPVLHKSLTGGGYDAPPLAREVMQAVEPRSDREWELTHLQAEHLRESLLLLADSTDPSTGLPVDARQRRLVQESRLALAGLTSPAVRGPYQKLRERMAPMARRDLARLRETAQPFTLSVDTV